MSKRDFRTLLTCWWFVGPLWSLSKSSNCLTAYPSFFQPNNIHDIYTTKEFRSVRRSNPDFLGFFDVFLCFSMFVPMFSMFFLCFRWFFELWGFS